MTRAKLDSRDREIVAATQAGLPFTRRPYKVIADRLGIPEKVVIQRIDAMLAAGVIRRIGVVPNHYALGVSANGMSVWDVDDEVAVELGRSVGALDFVSHCYLRPRRLPQWRYNLFAMVHGTSGEEVERKASGIGQLLGAACSAHDILYSTKILKKTGLRIAA